VHDPAVMTGRPGPQADARPGVPTTALEHYLVKQNRHLQQVIFELERRCSRLEMELQMLLPSRRALVSDD
jgi:hypothetical protein